MNAAEITDKLGLHSLRQRHWYVSFIFVHWPFYFFWVKHRHVVWYKLWNPQCRYIQSTCATSGEGLYEGLDWLSNNIANKVWASKKKKKRKRINHTSLNILLTKNLSPLSKLIFVIASICFSGLIPWVWQQWSFVFCCFKLEWNIVLNLGSRCHIFNGPILSIVWICLFLFCINRNGCFNELARGWWWWFRIENDLYS